MMKNNNKCWLDKKIVKYYNNNCVTYSSRSNAVEFRTVVVDE